jgi:hypothetical protein
MTAECRTVPCEKFFLKPLEGLAGSVGRWASYIDEVDLWDLRYERDM